MSRLVTSSWILIVPKRIPKTDPIYPSHVSIEIPAPVGSVMGFFSHHYILASIGETAKRLTSRLSSIWAEPKPQLRVSPFCWWCHSYQSLMSSNWSEMASADADHWCVELFARLPAFQPSHPWATSPSSMWMEEPEPAVLVKIPVFNRQIDG
jgi:hypothetical protein